MDNITIEEALKILRNFIDYFNKNKCDGNKANLNVLGEEIIAIEKVLNELDSEKQYHQWDLEKLQDYHKENSELNITCMQLESELNEKDKMINAIAQEWFELDELFMIRGKDIHNVDELKQYFKNKIIFGGKNE